MFVRVPRVCLGRKVSASLRVGDQQVGGALLDEVASTTEPERRDEGWLLAKQLGDPSGETPCPVARNPWQPMAAVVKTRGAERSHRKEVDSYDDAKAVQPLEVSQLAHDLKNLILPIQAAAEFLLESDSPENRKRYLRTILQQVDRMRLLIEDMFVSPEGIMRRCPVNITELVSLVARRVEQDCRVGISCLYPRIEPIFVWANEPRLWRALYNLALNAAQAVGPSGKVEIRLSLEPSEQVACVEIVDSGPGIPPNHRKHVFDPFFTTKPAGTGLGLTVAKHLIEQCGGRISFRSTVAEGTTFSVWLPLGGPPEG